MSGLVARIWTTATRAARVQHVYYALALFDVTAVAAGLYLTHYLNGILRATVQEGLGWNALHGTLGDVRQMASKMIGPGNDVFESKDVERERRRFRTARNEFLRTFENMKQSVAVAIPGEQAGQLHGHAVTIDTAVYRATTETAALLDLFAKGEFEGASLRMAAMNRYFAELLQSIEWMSSFLREAQEGAQQRSLAATEKLRSLEALLGVTIMLMVLGVTAYGHWLGRLFQHRYDELEQSYGAQRLLTDKLSVANGNVTQLNDELKALNANLEDRVAERTAELTQANASITELNVSLANTIVRLRDAQDEIVRKGKMAQLGQLTATVAHEIRNPLGAVRTAAYLVERKLKDVNVDVSKQFERLNNGVSRCDHIITELLDFARAGTVNCKSRNLGDWVREICEEERKSLPEQVQVDVDVSAADFEVEFDSDRMRRVLINLLSNAAEAMVGKGNERPKIVTDSPSIWVTAGLEGGRAVISVQDNGPGIGASDRQKILEPLYTTKSFGVGLGLPAVQKIMELHHGGLEIESTPGAGATFKAWLPLRRSSEKAA